MAAMNNKNIITVSKSTIMNRFAQGLHVNIYF